MFKAIHTSAVAIASNAMRTTAHHLLLVFAKFLVDVAQNIMWGVGLLVLASLLFLDGFEAVRAGAEFFEALFIIRDTLTTHLGLVGACGIIATTLFICSGLDALAWGGIWHALSQDERPTLDDLCDAFPRAFALRWISRLTTVTIVAIFATTIVTAIVLSDAHRWGLWIQSSVFALAFATTILLATLTRFAADLIPGVMFVERLGFGDAIFRAAEIVCENLVLVYMVFIRAIVFILPAIAAYYIAAILQNVALIAPEMAGIANSVRLFVDLFAALNWTLVLVYLQASMFNVVRHTRNGETAVNTWPEWVTRFLPSSELALEIGALLPTTFPHRVSLTETLVTTRKAATYTTPQKRTDVRDAFNLGAILKEEE